MARKLEKPHQMSYIKIIQADNQGREIYISLPHIITIGKEILHIDGDPKLITIISTTDCSVYTYEPMVDILKRIHTIKKMKDLQ